MRRDGQLKCLNSWQNDIYYVTSIWTPRADSYFSKRTPKHLANAREQTLTVHQFAARAIRKRPNLATGVVEQLVAEIVTGHYPVGTSLPPENILCDQFEVSRTVIREATKALIEKGLVDSQQGRGTIVRESDEWNLLDSMVLANLFQREDGLTYLDNLIEIRVALEASMAAKAATRATPADRQMLIRQRSRLEETKDEPATYVVEDIALHNLVMEISGDKLSSAIIRAVHGKAREAGKYHGRVSDRLMTETHAGHLAIIDAILGGDAEAAGRAMQHHIESAWKTRREP